jgi:hypothetical protein
MLIKDTIILNKNTNRLKFFILRLEFVRISLSTDENGSSLSGISAIIAQ